MKDNFARTLSVVFHPLFMPTFGITLLFSFDNFYGFFPLNYKLFIFLTIWVFTLLIPIVTFWVLKKTGQISDYNLRDKKERLLPMILSFCCYLAACIILWRFRVPWIIFKFMLGGILTLVVAGVITPFWKVSAHMAGIGGFTGVVFMLSLVLHQDLTMLFSLLVFIGGWLGWARLELNAHSIEQVAGGYLLGFLVMVSVYMGMV